ARGASAGRRAGRRDGGAGPAHVGGVEVEAEALADDLALVLVAVRAAEDRDRAGRGAAQAVDDREWHERVAPVAIEVTRELIVVLPGFREIDSREIVDDGRRHRRAL